MRLITRLLLASVVILSIELHGQQGSDPTPRFRSGARLVQVSVAVRDSRGRPVEGLDRAAFQVFEDGREQPVAFFVPAPPAGGSKNPAPVTTGPREPRFTNRIDSPGTGGVVAIIFDQLNSTPAQQMRARSHLIDYLKTVRPGDRIALYVLGEHSLQVLYDFTTDAEMLVRALDAITTGSGPKLGTAQQIPPALLEGLSAFASANFANMNSAVAQLRSEMTLENLEHVAAHIAGVPGRKNLIWLSSGFPFIIGHATPAGRYDEFQTQQTRRATRALNSADATLYPVDLRGLIAPQGGVSPSLNTIHTPLEGLRAAADWTGGRLFYNTNGISQAMQQAVEDSRSTYVLGYYPSNPDWNGQFRSVKVKVSRKGLEVRHREGYTAHAPVVASQQEDRQKGMLDALKAPLEATTLPFDVRPDVRADDVLLRLQVQATDLTLTEAAGQLTGALDVVIAQVGADGRLAPEVSATYPFSVPAADRARLLATPIELTRTVRLAPGTRQLRIVLRDSGSASVGSLFIDAHRLRPDGSR